MQPKSIQEILLPILDIIGYQNDKDAFIAKFSQAALEKTFADVLTSLPLEKQKEFAQEIANKTPEEIQAIAKNYFDTTTYVGKLGETIGNMIHDYLETILPECSEEQQEQIQAHLASLNTENN